MTETITEKQYDNLITASYTNPEKFMKLIEDYTGITARHCAAYQFFDPAGNFIGDNWNESLSTVLSDVGIEVVEDG